jgi:prophage regulatory protein
LESAKRLIRSREVETRTGFHITTIWRLEKRSEFPQRVRLSANRVAWLESDIDAWIDGRSKGGGLKPNAAIAARQQKRVAVQKRPRLRLDDA